MVCLGNAQRSFCHLWDCIQVLHLDSFVDHDGYSISSKGFLPAVVDITHSSSFQFADSYNVDIHSCHLLFDHFQIALIHGANIPGSCAILFFTAWDFTSTTSHIHNWVLFLLWLCLFFLSGVMSPLISSSILGSYWPGELIFQCPIFLPFHTVHGFSRQEYWSGLSFPSPVYHSLSEPSTTILMSWVALHSMAHGLCWKNLNFLVWNNE